MANLIQFAVLQKTPDAPTAEQLKRAFRSFSHLTDADAVRLAAEARGILLRHATPEAARALQAALQTEGVGATIVAENNLPALPQSRPLHRLEVWPQTLVVFDALGRRIPVDWQDVKLVAAGAARGVEVNKGYSRYTALQFNPVTGLWPQRVEERTRKVESESKFLLELLLAGGATSYELDAGQFQFKCVLDRPGLALEEKFIWLVREICRYAPRALLNAGARTLRDGAETVPAYANRQALADEMTWLLWSSAGPHRAAGA